MWQDMTLVYVSDKDNVTSVPIVTQPVAHGFEGNNSIRALEGDAKRM